MENPGIAPEKREEAAKTLREILDRMGIEAEVSAFDDGDRIILDAHGAESGLIIGKKGATLDASQYVINRIISKKPNDGPGVVVDAEGYRGRREDSLVDLANRLADKAIKTGRPVPVEPMNPHDRRIVHVTLKEHPGVTTESDGEGLFRRVVIYPKDRPAAGARPPGLSHLPVGRFAGAHLGRELGARAQKLLENVLADAGQQSVCHSIWRTGAFG